MTNEQTEQAVIVRFFDFASKFWTDKSQDLGALYALEDELETVIQKAGAGELDGHDLSVDGSDGTIFLYGPNADTLFEVVEPVLSRSPVAQGANVKLCYGKLCEANVLEKSVDIKSVVADVHR